MNINTPVKIVLIDGGPMIITGNFELIDAAGNVMLLTEDKKSNGVALCRCGKTKTQPCCDGSHITK